MADRDPDSRRSLFPRAGDPRAYQAGGVAGAIALAVLTGRSYSPSELAGLVLLSMVSTWGAVAAYRASLTRK